MFGFDLLESVGQFARLNEKKKSKAG